jgi:PEP-CTERM motif
VQDGLTATAGSASTVFTSTNSGAQTNLWQAESLAFTAAGTATTISLIGNSGVNYIGLDNVSVVQTAAGVPEPAIWMMMLIGIGGIGAALRTRRGYRPAAGLTAPI